VSRRSLGVRGRTFSPRRGGFRAAVHAGSGATMHNDFVDREDVRA
jgi:hypothetical protein